MSEHDADEVVERIAADDELAWLRMLESIPQSIIAGVLGCLKPGDDLGNGLVAVPREPTEKMLRAGNASGIKASVRTVSSDVYRAMIAASGD